MTTLNVATGADRKVSFFVPLSKIDPDKQMVYGYASTEAKDSDGEIVTIDALKAALPGYMAFGNIREMHQLSAVGVTKQADIDDKGLYIGAKIVDPVAWDKVKEGVYKGFSIGGSATQRSGNRIEGLNLIEISLVDRPANPEALIEVFKAQTEVTVTEPIQTWSCGIAGHTHVAKAEAVTCIANQSPDIIAKRKLLVEAVNELPPEQLEVAVAAFQKRATSSPEPAPAAVEPRKEGMTDQQVEVLAQTFGARILSVDLSTVGTPSALSKALGCQEEVALKALDYAGQNYVKQGSALPPGLVALQTRIKKNLVIGPDPTIPKLSALEEDRPSAPREKASDGKAPEGDYGTHEEAGYADPGLQEDKKPRYPLKKDGEWNEGHIRAAWNYINKDNNAAIYSPAQVEEIKNRIVAAWKAKIDPEGPPSAQAKAHQPSKGEHNVSNVLRSLGQPDAKSGFKKGLMTVCAAIGLLERLNDLQRSLVIEAAAEKDNSEMPQRFQDVVKMMSTLVQELLQEEAGELLNNPEMADFDAFRPSLGAPGPVAFAATVTKFAGPAVTPGMMQRLALHVQKAIGDATGSVGWDPLSDVVDLLEKAGEVTTFTATEPEDTQMWGDHGNTSPDAMTNNNAWQKVHDNAVEMGAKCAVSKANHAPPPPPKGAEEEDDDAGYEGDGKDETGMSPDMKRKRKQARQKMDMEAARKKAAGNDVTAALAKNFEALSHKLDTLTETLSSLQRDPPKPKGTLHAVGKGQDISTGDNNVTPATTPTPADVLAKCLADARVARL